MFCGLRPELKLITVFVMLQLEDVNWRLNLQMAQANKSKLKIPNALFELGVKDQNTEVTVFNSGINLNSTCFWNTINTCTICF